MHLGVGLCVTLVLWIGSASAGPGLLFRHGLTEGDVEFPRTVDDDFELATTSHTYRFFNKLYTKLYVSTNGYVTFDEGYWWYNPRYTSAFSGPKMVAAYWSDIYLPALIPAQHIRYRESTTTGMRDRASKIVQKDFGSCGDTFEATAVFIVTYKRLASYCQSQSCCMSECDGGSRKREAESYEDDKDDKPFINNTAVAKEAVDWEKNSFQLVIATDGWNTFAITNMKIVQWDCCFNQNKMLFNAGDGVGFYMNPITDDELVLSSNVGPRGRWVYKISESQIQDPSCAFIGT